MNERPEMSQKPFLAENFLKQTTYFLLEAKKPPYFIACERTRYPIVSNYQTQQNKISGSNPFHYGF